MDNLAFYLTIEKNCIFEIEKIKGSRFISLVYHIETEDEASEILKKVKKTYYDARHHCYAFKIRGKQFDIIRQSDDGEPSKTAGIPILNILEHSKLTNILIIVVRYFGGVKLGTGGLTKAYSLAAKSVLEKAEVVSIELKDELTLSFSYPYTQTVYSLLNSYSCKIIEQNYTEDINLKVLININNIELLKKELIDATSDNILILQ